VSVPFDLAPVSDADGDGPATEIQYVIDLQVTGRLAAFGVPLLRDTLRRQVAELIVNVERELAGQARDGQGGPS
jgi:carbon monoxide dehydrogenase subunit G